MGHEILDVGPVHMRVLRTSNRFGAQLQAAVFWLSLSLCSLLLVWQIATMQNRLEITFKDSVTNGTETLKSLPTEFSTLKSGQRGKGSAK